MVQQPDHDIEKKPANRGADASNRKPNEIGTWTPFDFESKNLTAYGGLLPVAAMLERLEFQELVEELVTVKRLTRSMSTYQFVLAMVLAWYADFFRLSHLSFLKGGPVLTAYKRF